MPPPIACARSTEHQRQKLYFTRLPWPPLQVQSPCARRVEHLTQRQRALLRMRSKESRAQPSQPTGQKYIGDDSVPNCPSGAA